MRIQYQHKSRTDRARRTSSFSVNLGQVEVLRRFSKRLLIVPAAILLLFSCGQLAILTSSKLAEKSMPIPAGADVGPWAYVLIHSSSSEKNELAFQGRYVGTIPSDAHDGPSSARVLPQPSLVITENPTAVNTQPPPSPENTSKPSPTMTPQDDSKFTATPTMESSPQPTDSPTQSATEPSNPDSNLFCDAAGKPLSYEHLHHHAAYLRGYGFGTIIHAIPIDGEETQVILEKVMIKQNQDNPSILKVVSADWSHWDMGSIKIPIQETQPEVTITPNLEFYPCFAADKCDHSLYGGDIYIEFEDELSGEYELFMDVYFPEYEERCKLGLLVHVSP